MFHYKRKIFSVVIDYFSKFIETAHLERVDSSHILVALKSIFARHGIRKVIRLDKATNYSSEQFRSFVESWGITHIISSLTHPQSNGMVERIGV